MLEDPGERYTKKYNEALCIREYDIAQKLITRVVSNFDIVAWSSAAMQVEHDRHIEVVRSKRTDEIRFYRDGFLYRGNDKPCIVRRKSCEWGSVNKHHRDTDNPSIIATEGYSEYYKNGQLHREGGPAIYYTGGARRWYLNGRLHCSYGPAARHIPEIPGSVEYWLSGEQVSLKSFEMHYMLLYNKVYDGV